jgi:hypothetical protein
MLRYFVAIALVSGLTHVAKADDFQMVVGDPTVPFYVIQTVLFDNFAVDFPTSGPAAGCGASGQLPSGIPDPQDYTACFTGINLTGHDMTSLQIEFPVFDYPGTSTPDTPNCPALSSGAIFSNATCGLTNGGADYLLQFSGGDIPASTSSPICSFDTFGTLYCTSPAIFTIAMGIPGLDLIQDGTIATLDSEGISASAGVTPEPSSIWLMLTGVLSIGLYSAHRRRQNPEGQRLLPAGKLG